MLPLVDSRMESCWARKWMDLGLDPPSLFVDMELYCMIFMM
jgi:hypothetical protein